MQPTSSHRSHSASWSLAQPAILVCIFFFKDSVLNSCAHPTSGSHVVFALQQTRRYKVITIDNHNNSLPAALTRVAQLAHDALPENATDADKDSAEIDTFECDLTSSEQVRAIFEKYGKGGIWGIVHIAVRAFGLPRVSRAP